MNRSWGQGEQSGRAELEHGGKTTDGGEDVSVRTRTDFTREQADELIAGLKASASIAHRQASSSEVAARHKCEAEFVGLCQNPAVADSEIERIVSMSIAGSPFVLLEAVLGAYVIHRKPGAWFWGWWEDRIFTGRDNWLFGQEYRHALLEAYIAKGDVTEEDIAMVGERLELYYSPKAYSSHWLSVDRARRWLVTAGRIHSQENEYDSKVIETVYLRDPKRAIEIMDANILGAILRNSLKLKAEPLVRRAIVGMEAEMVADGIVRAHPSIWEANGWGKVVVELFEELDNKVKAQVLELAPVAMRNEIIGVVGRASSAKY